LWFGFVRRVTLGLDLPNQRQGHDQPLAQAVQFRPQMARDLATVTGAQSSKVALPGTQRGPLSDALGEQQGLDAVLDAQPLLYQVLAFAVRTLCIFLLPCRHADHAAGLPVTPKIGGEHAQHALRVEPVGLGPAGTAVDEDAGRLEHVVNHTMRRQQPVQPEAVPSCLKAADDADRRAEPSRDASA
jgi:hypothetical protein